MVRAICNKISMPWHSLLYSVRQSFLTADRCRQATFKLGFAQFTFIYILFRSLSSHYREEVTLMHKGAAVGVGHYTRKKNGKLFLSYWLKWSFPGHCTLFSLRSLRYVCHGYIQVPLGGWGRDRIAAASATFACFREGTEKWSFRAASMS